MWTSEAWPNHLTIISSNLKVRVSELSSSAFWLFKFSILFNSARTFKFGRTLLEMVRDRTWKFGNPFFKIVCICYIQFWSVTRRVHDWFQLRPNLKVWISKLSISVALHHHNHHHHHHNHQQLAHFFVGISFVEFRSCLCRWTSIVIASLYRPTRAKPFFTSAPQCWDKHLKV